jgi:MFS family permease
MEESLEQQPLRPLSQDRSFWGLVITQFLGAFNDNIYKTSLALLFVAVPAGMNAAGEAITRDWQGEGDFIFGLPFLLFSGWAGFLSDRYSKRTIFVLCKVAEIAIMLVGLFLFIVYGHGPLTVPLLALFFAVLFCMGSHSAFFGPGKYGVLPELFHENQLPLANGIILMTTFIAIILGIGLAGVMKDAFAGSLYPIGIVCCIVAVVGTCSSLWIRPTPVSNAELSFTSDMLFIPGAIRQLLASDRILLGALISSSVFWMAAGMVKSSVVALGKLQLQLSDSQSTLLLSAVSVGIILGAPLAGYLSGGRFHVGVLKSGAWGICICLGVLAIPGGAQGQLVGYYGSFACLLGVGMFAGLLSVPLQVFMQMRPPKDLKGRMIATMNFLNFLGIVLAGPIYSFTSNLLVHWKWLPSTGFLVPACFLMLVGLFYRPRPIAEHSEFVATH